MKQRRGTPPGRRPGGRSVAASPTAIVDWRDATLSRLRRTIRAADPAAVEEIKWRKPSRPEGVPVWFMTA